MTSVLITGAAGFIGYHLSRRLLEGGHRVLGVDNFNDYYDPRHKRARSAKLQAYPTFAMTEGDINDPQCLDAAFDQIHPEWVVHLAAQAGVRYSIHHPMVYIHANVEGFQRVLEKVRALEPRRFVYASSSSVYGQNVPPFHECQDVTSPQSLYAATKVANELVAKTYSNLFGISSVGLRFFTVYGPCARPDMAMYKFCTAIAKGLPIEIYNHGNMVRDFTYCDDIVDGIVAALHAELVGARVYNLGKGKGNGLLEMVETIETEMGGKTEHVLSPLQLGDVPETVADISLAKAELGYVPKVSLADGVKSLVRWYKETHRQGEFIGNGTATT